MDRGVELEKPDPDGWLRRKSEKGGKAWGEIMTQTPADMGSAFEEAENRLIYHLLLR
jgi:hypothetical protein